MRELDPAEDGYDDLDRMLKQRDYSYPVAYA